VLCKTYTLYIMDNQTSNRIALLRSYMKKRKLQAFVIPSTDAHISEYVHDHWRSMRWISGFAGSVGTLVVTLDKAVLWTDSRYFLQAEKELEGSEIVLFKELLPNSIKISDWLKSELSSGNRVGVDGDVYKTIEAVLLNAELIVNDIRLVTSYFPFKEIWEDRPALPKNPVSLHPIEFAGESVKEKINRVLARAKAMGGDAVFVSSLDAIAWLFNIRGSDVPHNPVVIAHAFVSESKKILFVDREKISPAVAAYLKKNSIKILNYNKTNYYLTDICDMSVCVDMDKISQGVYGCLKICCKIINTVSIVDSLKSIKNEIEVEGFRRVMVRDGVALTKFFMWLEKSVPKGLVTEYNVGVKLKELRGEQENFVGESFNTIAGYAANGAIVHYHPSEENCLEIKQEGLLLIDSGGQSRDGTTDITRTVAMGALTDEMKKDYTLILKGVIGLSEAVFPAGTRGSQIDVLARKAMWEHGINYLHGTGHGVGSFLNVHEGPHNIRQEENHTALCPGMIVTNEPGIYRSHKYGIRIENMLLTAPAMTTEYGDFYKFETLTLCYIDTAPIIKEMMTPSELAWLNEYHKTVYKKLSPHLSKEESTWLKVKTESIT